MEASAGQRKPRRLPGVEGVWVFVAADIGFFAILFVSFMLARREKLALFESGRRALDFNFGGVNTLILLTSSWLVALAVDAAKRDRNDLLVRCLRGALACGVAFDLSKIIEYSREIRSGFSPLTDDFYMYYFTLTGIHFVHVTAGCVVLALLLRNAQQNAYGSQLRSGLETGATYWHMVDLLWIMIFPLLYLLR